MCVSILIWLIVSRSLQPHELESTRLLYPWNFPRKNTGVASHFLFQVSLQPKDWNLFSCISCIGRQFLYHWHHLESLYICMYACGEGNGNPLQYSCLGNPMDGGAWWATVHWVAKSRTRLSDFTSKCVCKPCEVCFRQSGDTKQAEASVPGHQNVLLPPRSILLSFSWFIYRTTVF